MHLDGARLFNAAVATAQGRGISPEDRSGGSFEVGAYSSGVNLKEGISPTREQVVSAARAICSHFDTVSLCLSKGLGAPVGSLILGDAGTIARARRIRKMLGGGMRQAGFIAAAGLYALEHHLQRLADDHRNARELAQGLRRIAASPGPLEGKLKVTDPDTNILFVDVDPGVGDAFQAHLSRSNVAVTGGAYHGGLRQRWVTHLDVDAADVEQALEVIRRFEA
jgi:threonine aldolase